MDWLKRLVGWGPSRDEFTITNAGSVDEAIAEARRTLPIFWSRFDAQDADAFQLKAGLTTPAGAVEHIWIEPIERRDGKIVGRLINEPVDLDDVFLGDEVLVDAERVSDWGYVKDGLLFGAFTQRAMLDRLSPKMRREVVAALSPDPLESDPT